MLVLASFSGLVQYAVDGFINGSSYGLLGISFGLIVAVTGRFHFAWAMAYAIAGFFAAWLSSHVGVAAVPAIALSLLGAIAFNEASELLVYRRIVARVGPEMALLVVFVASFGITIAVENAITWAIGANNSVQTLSWISTSPLHVGQIVFTVLDVASVVAAWALCLMTWAMLRFSSLGRRLRAVQVNPEMSESVGIDVERTYMIVFAISAVLGGVPAVFASMEYAGTPDMGLTPVFYAFVVAFAAGLGRSPLRVMVVGAAIGVVEGLSAQFLSVQWQEVVVFGILLIYLIGKALRAWRPGLFAIAAPARSASVEPGG